MYNFIIPNKKIFTYQVFAYGIVLLNILAAFLYQYKISGGANSVFVLSIGALSLAVIAWDLYRYKKDNRLSSLGLIILFWGLIWLRLGGYPVFFINLALWALYVISRRNLMISVNKGQVIYPSFPKKSIGWSEISNVVLKDDILTIDLKNNKIYQHEIEYTVNEVNEEEFNEFCRKLVDR